MEHLKTMSPEIVVNVQDSKLYSVTPLVMARWYSPWDLKEGSGLKPVGVRVKALPLSSTLGVANRLSIKSAIVFQFYKRNCTLSTRNCIQGL
jgi:hypothetical protein